MFYKRKKVKTCLPAVPLLVVCNLWSCRNQWSSSVGIRPWFAWSGCSSGVVCQQSRVESCNAAKPYMRCALDIHVFNTKYKHL